MKKLVCLGAAAVIAATSAFAGVEMDLSYYGILSNNSDVNVTGLLNMFGGLDAIGDGDFTMPDMAVHSQYGSPFGMRTDFNFYFGSPWALDIGMNLSSGFSVVPSITNSVAINDIDEWLASNAGEDWDSLSEEDKADARKEVQEMLDTFNGTGTGGFGFFLKIGPAVRFNLHHMHSIYFAPTVFVEGAITGLSDLLNSAESGSGDEFSFPHFALGLGLDFDIGYRCWLVEKPKMLFGVNAGLDLSVPLFMYTSGFGIKLYAGAVISFGKRGTPVL